MISRSVILAAADHIERHPETYSFMRNEVPWDLQDRGCMMGWMMYFGDSKRQPGYDSVFDRAPAFLGMSGAYFLQQTRGAGWRPSDAVRALRKFAKQFPYDDPVDLSLPVWAQMRDREAVEEGRKGKCPKEAYKRFRFQLVLEPRTIMPSEVSEEVKCPLIS